MAVIDKKVQRARRHARIRKKISGTAERPRFCVSITTNHIYCQFIDDVNGRTLAMTSSLDPKFKAENARPNMAGAVLLGPASAGTGLIAGGAVRAILELAGVEDVLAKSLGASNAANVAKATFKAISQLSTRDEVFARRGIALPKTAQAAPEAPAVENN